MNEACAIRIHRLGDLDEWELYDVTVLDDESPLTIGLRPHSELGQVEYQVWDDSTEEPLSDGSVPCDVTSGRWACAPRDPLMAEILAQFDSPE